MRSSGLQRPKRWPPRGGPYRLDRLAFLAARPELERRSQYRRPYWLFRALRVVGTIGELLIFQDYGGDGSRYVRTDYMLACYEVAGMLDPLEQQRLRSNGELPAWFFDEVQRVAPRHRKRRK